MTTLEVLKTFSKEDGIKLFNERKTDKEVYDLCVAKGLTDSYETFTAESQKVFSEKLSKMSKEEILTKIEGAELTDEQLEQIAGGKEDLTGEKLGAVIAGEVLAAAVSIAAATAFM